MQSKVAYRLYGLFPMNDNSSSSNVAPHFVQWCFLRSEDNRYLGRIVCDMEREPKLSSYFIIWTVFNSIRDKSIPPEGPHSWHWKVLATLFVRHLESLDLFWNTTLQPKHAFSSVETWVSWHHRCPNLSGYSGMLIWLRWRAAKSEFEPQLTVALFSFVTQSQLSPTQPKTEKTVVTSYSKGWNTFFISFILTTRAG